MKPDGLIFSPHFLTGKSVAEAVVHGAQSRLLDLHNLEASPCLQSVLS